MEHDENGKVSPIFIELVHQLHSMYGNQPAMLGDFGVSPRKTTKLTPEQEVQAIAKRKATRAARHTMGAKQKLAVKGVVADPVEGPAAVPANAGTGATPKP